MSIAGENFRKYSMRTKDKRHVLNEITTVLQLNLRKGIHSEEERHVNVR